MEQGFSREGDAAEHEGVVEPGGQRVHLLCRPPPPPAAGESSPEPPAGRSERGERRMRDFLSMWAPRLCFFYVVLLLYGPRGLTGT